MHTTDEFETSNGAGKPNLTEDDIRAACDADIIDAKTAEQLNAFIRSRRSRTDDEPVRVFSGFAEIFVSLGLVIAIIGATTLSWGNSEGFWPPVLTLAVCCALLPVYFVKRKRMVLPGIVLAIGWSIAVALCINHLLGDWQNDHLRFVALMMAAALVAWYAVHKVPFTLFLTSMAVLAFLLSFVPDIENPILVQDWKTAFSLTGGTTAPFLTLLFGIGATTAAMLFDFADPRRIGNASACAFWLHLAAAPAIVNTVAWTAWSSGGNWAALFTAMALVPILLFALLIDRRSFAAAGTIWGGVLLAQVFDQNAWILLVLGLAVVLLATFWSGLRSMMFAALPDWSWLGRLTPVTDTSRAGNKRNLA